MDMIDMTTNRPLRSAILAFGDSILGFFRNQADLPQLVVEEIPKLCPPLSHFGRWIPVKMLLSQINWVIP